MTKFERAVKAAEELPDDVREELGDNLLHYIDRYLALRDDIALGVEQIERGEMVDGEIVLAKLRARFAS